MPPPSTDALEAHQRLVRLVQSLIDTRAHASRLGERKLASWIRRTLRAEAHLDDAGVRRAFEQIRGRPGRFAIGWVQAQSRQSEH